MRFDLKSKQDLEKLKKLGIFSKHCTINDCDKVNAQVKIETEKIVCGLFGGFSRGKK